MGKGSGWRCRLEAGRMPPITWGKLVSTQPQRVLMIRAPRGVFKVGGTFLCPIAVRQDTVPCHADPGPLLMPGHSHGENRGGSEHAPENAVFVDQQVFERAGSMKGHQGDEHPNERAMHAEDLLGQIVVGWNHPGQLGAQERDAIF